MTQLNYNKKKYQRPASGVNPRSYRGVVDSLGDFCEILGLARTDFTRIETKGGQIFGMIGLDSVSKSKIPLPPQVLVGAFEKFSHHIVGRSFGSNLEDVHRNNAMTFMNDPHLSGFLNETKTGIVPVKAEALYFLGDINFAANTKLRAIKRNVAIELGTICTARAEILDFLKTAENLTGSKVETYNKLAIGLRPYWMNHDLSWQGLTEQNLNDPEWIEQQTSQLRKVPAQLLPYFPKAKVKKQIKKIINYGVGITKKRAHQIAYTQ